MRTVRDVRVTVVNVPFTTPETWYFGRSWGLTSAVVEVETDDGIVGIGECPGVPTIAAATHAIGVMTPLLIDRDAADILPFLRRVRMEGWHHFPYQGNVAVASLEMAMWDIVGKALNQPVYNLLGGPCRKRLRAYTDRKSVV